MSLLKRIKAAGSILFDGASTTTSQRGRNAVLMDTKKSLQASQWRTMSAYSRQLYAQLGEVRGAICEKSMYTIGCGWIPQFYGMDKAWGSKAEAWLWEWMKICDVRGEPYDFRTGLKIASIAIDRDGDVGCALIRTPDNYPQIQWLPNHRISSRGFETLVTTGPYSGLGIYHGVIYNDFGRPVAFKVLGEALDGSQDQVISARDMMIMYDPDWHDQARGIPGFYHAILDLMDRQDIKTYQKTAIKTASTIALQEFNEEGAADSTAAYLTSSTNDTGTGISIEEIQAGIRYMKANSGAKLEILSDNRPSPNTVEFMEKVLRSAYQGIKWPYDFTRDPTKLGGVNGRIVLAQANRTINERQELLRKYATRIVGFAISKAIQNKLLPPSDEWWMFDFQMPKAITADAGREALQDREDVKAGLRSVKEDASERGEDWQEMRDQIEREAGDILVRAQRLSKENNVSLDVAIGLLQMRTPNGNLAASANTNTDPTNTNL